MWKHFVWVLDNGELNKYECCVRVGEFECCTTNMKALWAEELFMWMLHDEYECFVSWRIVCVNVTRQTWKLCECWMNSCLYVNITW
jgi:predicted NAD-dependent protein-ADP-ribosyltransferase YbiA (DUF1768 family)